MLRERQAASFLGVASKTLANWRSQGKGPKFCRLGRAIAYRQEDLDAFVADALTDPSDKPALHILLNGDELEIEPAG